MNAQITMQQIGTANLMRVGARLFVAGENSLHFAVGRGGLKIHIRLEADDTYTVSLWRVRGADMKMLDEVEGVYCDCLAAAVLKLAGEA